MRNFRVTPIYGSRAVFAAQYDEAAVHAAAIKCKQISDILRKFVDTCSDKKGLSVKNIFKSACDGCDQQISNVAYDILVNTFTMTRLKATGGGFMIEPVPKVDVDVICLVFAEITPSGEVITNESGLLAYYTTVSEYEARYRHSKNDIKTLYCQLLSSWDYPDVESFDKRVFEQIASVFEDAGLAVDYRGGSSIDIGRTLKDIWNRQCLSFYIDVSHPHVLSRTYSQFPHEYIDVLHDKVNIPKSFVDEVKAKVMSLGKGWPSASYWDDKIPGESSATRAWKKWLQKPEDKVNSQLQLNPEPSTQLEQGYVYIYDESGNRGWEEPIKVNYVDWVEDEIDMARNSISAAEYEKRYADYLKQLVGE